LFKRILRIALTMMVALKKINRRKYTLRSDEYKKILNEALMDQRLVESIPEYRDEIGE